MREVYDRIDAKFECINVRAYVSRFYSDKDNIVVASSDKDDLSIIKDVMSQFSYTLYDMGANNTSYMLTFKEDETS